MITFDSKMLNKFAEENKSFFTGARINKIQQPTRREIILYLRNNGKTKQFYINIDPQVYHTCFINENSFNKRHLIIPQKPPMFCMLLRKYLNNSKIAKINQPEGERILELYFETYNELGDSIYFCLAIELMGKYSNVILYNTDTGIIIGCAHNVGADKSQKREVYGQIPYTYPPKHIDYTFLNQRYGFLDSFNKNIYSDRINDIIDQYYAGQISRIKFKTTKNNYLSQVNQKLTKCIKAIKETTLQIIKNKNSEKYRLHADLLMANLYNLKDYTKEAKVFDYENNQAITIELDETKTIKENANVFYKKYNKTKKSNEKIKELNEEYSQKKIYYEQLLYSITASETHEELEELKDEVESITPIEKYDKRAIEPLKIEKENETRIYIGKNNKQNDYIISKLASEDDLWFHTKDCPGSHVLLKTQKLTDELILECAKLAKKYSSGSDSSKIGVIYTKRKYLRKPPKANLGYVTYKNEKEIVID